MDFIPRNVRYIRDINNLLEIYRILARGDDPNQTGYGGLTPLHKAIRLNGDNIELVNELLNAGADVNLRSHLDESPLHYAVLHHKLRIFEALIQSGAFPNFQDYLGRTVLHLAVSEFKIHNGWPVSNRDTDEWFTTKLLTLNDIDCNLVDYDGNTPLMIAVKNEECSTTLLLLLKQANPDISNKNAKTPLHVAFSLPPNVGFSVPPKVACSLPPNGTDIQLLRFGASIYAVDKNGQTPIDILLTKGLQDRGDEYLKVILKIIAFKYCITNDIKQKFFIVPKFFQYLNECCREVDEMRSDFISGNITLHDCLMNCFNESQFESVAFQIHKPVFDRLVRDIYPEYFNDIKSFIPHSSLLEILEVSVSSKRRAKNNVGKDLAYLLSIRIIFFLVTKHLTYEQLFRLTVAYSNVKIPLTCWRSESAPFFT